MTVLKGLEAAKALVNKASGGNFEKTVWLSVGKDQSVKLVFAQEIDANSPKYDDKRGSGIFVVEHKSPKDYRIKAQCSLDDEGRCHPCEQNDIDPSGDWKQITRLYINVVVSNGIDDPYVAVMSQGMGKNSITPTLISYAEEPDAGGITGTTWKLTKNGEKRDTAWNIIPLGESKLDLDEFELYDLEKVATRKVPYEQQEAFYGGIFGSNVDEQQGEPAATKPVTW